jgi:GNAT superfamily N-acetyltransferase
MTIRLAEIDGIDAPPLAARGARELEPLTLAWGESRERQRIIALAIQAGQQTMNLRTMPGAELVVVRRWDGRLAGWAGVDTRSDPEYPEVFSQYVLPEFRGMGLGGLLAHVCWTHLDREGCATAYARVELNANRAFVERRLRTGYYRVVRSAAVGPRFLAACRKCERFGDACGRQTFLAVDVRKALAASSRSCRALDVSALPIQIPPGPERFKHFPCGADHRVVATSSGGVSAGIA